MFYKNVYIIHMYTSSLRPFRRGLESFLKFSFYKDKEDQMHLHLLVLWSLDVRPRVWYLSIDSLSWFVCYIYIPKLWFHIWLRSESPCIPAFLVFPCLVWSPSLWLVSWGRWDSPVLLAVFLVYSGNGFSSMCHGRFDSLCLIFSHRFSVCVCM